MKYQDIQLILSKKEITIVEFRVNLTRLTAVFVYSRCSSIPNLRLFVGLIYPPYTSNLYCLLAYSTHLVACFVWPYDLSSTC
jgi:hypothetical protein